ncbi:transcriptional regulator SlyA [compost metagenome]
MAEGLVERMGVDGDRRAFRVRLTDHGREQFVDMARQHEQWIVAAFEGLSARDLDNLHKLLGKVKQHQLDINQGGE